MKNKEQTFASKLLNIQILQLIDEIRNKFKESDKLNQIIKIIKEDNELESFEQLANSRKTLLKSCFNEDVELVRWLVKREYTDENGISYKIDSNTKTASIFSISSTQKDIFISKSIKYDDIEYSITNIFCFSCSFTDLKSVKFDKNSHLQSLGFLSFSKTLIEHISIPSTVIIIGEKSFYNCSNLKWIEIPENSQLKFIGNAAFSGSIIESLFIPSGFLEFENNWCIGANSLKQIVISPENHNFKFTEDQLLLGKSDKNSDNYDVLIFANRYIKTVTIPSNIKRIASGAFSGCTNLKSIEIRPDSELQFIEKMAFDLCPIEKLFIPSGFLEFEEMWCMGVDSLKQIIVSPENHNFNFTEDQLLPGKSDKNSDNYDILIFANRYIKTVIIPSNIKQIAANAFNNCLNLETVEFQENCELNSICKMAFKNTLIEKIVIPKQVTEIGQFAFYQCKNLKNVVIPQYSELKIIDEYVFAESSIEFIYIPSNVKKIANNAFNSCTQLRTVEIEKNSILNYIGECAFTKTLIRSIDIPSQVQIIDDKAFNKCIYLSKVEIHKESQLRKIGDKAFKNAVIYSSIIIPPHVTRIGKHAFYQCKYLRSVTIPKDSELKYIGEYAFYNTSIERIFIPKEVIVIENSTFSKCTHFQHIEFSENSKLQVIGDFAFADTYLKEISIPYNVTVILNKAFLRCRYLKLFQIPENSKLRMIGPFAFAYTSIQILYIPSCFCQFDKKWNIGLYNLREIIVSPENHNFKFTEDQLLLGKSDKNSDNYDVLIIANRYIKAVTIQSNIKIISSCAFEYCLKLETVEFQENSELHEISENSFTHTKIQNIKIPPNVTIIDKFAFSRCNLLQNIEIPTNSQLQKLGTCALTQSHIEELFIPSHFCELEKGWCTETNYLKNFKISKENKKFIFIDNQILYSKSDINSNIYNVIEYAVPSIQKVVIPSYVTKIGSCAFSNCLKVVSFEIQKNSQLKEIDKLGFAQTSVKKIIIPSNLITIGEYAFFRSKLELIEFPKNAELQVIKTNAFNSTAVKSFFITPKVTTIDEEAFENSSIIIVEILEKSNLKSFNGMKKLKQAIIMVPVYLNIKQQFQ